MTEPCRFVTFISKILLILCRIKIFCKRYGCPHFLTISLGKQHRNESEHFLLKIFCSCWPSLAMLPTLYNSGKNSGGLVYTLFSESSEENATVNYPAWFTKVLI